MSAESVPVAPAAPPAVVMRKPMKKGKKKKGKAAKKPVYADGEAPAPKPKPPSLKQQINDMLADRDIEEVVAQARQEVQACTKAIEDAEKEVSASDDHAAAAKRKLDEASHNVEMMVAKETIAYEKLKAAKLQQARATEDTQRAQAGRIEHSTAIVVLECEKNAREAVKDLEEAKKAAHDAYIQAQLKIAEEKKKEKEAQQAIKDTRKEQSEKEKEALQTTADGQIGEKAAAKEFARNAKIAEKAMKQEMNDIAKAKILREKARQRFLSDMNKKRKAALPALADGGAASPSKAARIQDVD